MYYGFDTSDEHAGIGALLVYGVYRSRDSKKFKITPDMWGLIERSVKSSAKRALDLNGFIEKLKPKLSCSTIRPQFMQTDWETVAMKVDHQTGEMIQIKDEGKRQFWVQLLETCDHAKVLQSLYKNTALMIALVRDRIERERPLEIKGIIKEEEIVEEIEWTS